MPPVPVDGDTRSAVTTAAAGAGTVHVPRVCQPLVVPLPFAAYMNTVLVPANAEANVTGTLIVNTLPLRLVVIAFNAIEHWLFCSVPPVPAIPDVYAVPALLRRFNVLVARA